MERREADVPRGTLAPGDLRVRLLASVPEAEPALGADACERLARYVGLVLDWGRRINLTGARTAVELVDDQVADALPALPWLPAGPFELVDVGSGAGLPGLVLAMLRPDARVVLLEPVGKKRAFLAHAIRELGLTGAEACAERLEAHLPAHAGAYDVATSRATWPAAVWIARGRALVRPGGLVLGFEGAAETGELPEGAERRPYRLHRRAGKLVLWRVPAA